MYSFVEDECSKVSNHPEASILINTFEVRRLDYRLSQKTWLLIVACRSLTSFPIIRLLWSLYDGGTFTSISMEVELPIAKSDTNS